MQSKPDDEKRPFAVIGTGHHIRKDWLDYVRVLAIFSVVVVHVSAYYYVQYGKIHQLDWWLADILNASSRFAVPLFVMVSGCLLLGQEVSLGSFYKKRLLRLLPATVFWNAVYLLFLVFTNRLETTNLLTFLETEFVSNGYTYFHLWYLSMFLCLMLFAPFVNMFIVGVKPTQRDLQVLILLLVAFSSLHLVSIVLGKLEGGLITWHEHSVWYFLYFLAGYYLNKGSWISKISNMTIVGVIISIISIGAALNYAMASRLHLLDDHLILDNEGPLVFVFTAMIFVLFRNNLHRLKRSALIVALSEASFGMYLVHAMYLYLFAETLPAYDQRGIIYMPLVIVLTLFCSFATIFVLRRIKVFGLVS